VGGSNIIVLGFDAAEHVVKKEQKLREERRKVG